MIRLLTALVLALTAMNVVAAEPRRWTPDVLSTDDYESSPAFMPNGRELFFMRADKIFQNYRLLWSACLPSGWAPGTAPPFAAPAPVLEGDPFVTSDGKRVYFISSRHAFSAGQGNEDLDIWYAERLRDGTWSADPVRLPEPVNSTASELLPRLARDGTLYFGSDRPGGLGGTDIYSARMDKRGNWVVANLGSPINSTNNEYEADISHNGRNLVLVADRGDRSHLYLFLNKSQGWVEDSRLSALPNVFQVGPVMSPLGDRLLFAQAYGALSGEIFLLDLVPKPNMSWPPSCPKRSRE